MVATDIRKEARESLKNKWVKANNRIINRDRKCTWR